jgi:queuine tRNA-ribosyltransferase
VTRPLLPFEVTARAAGSAARAGVLTTAHGTIATPAFMPVGTRGTVRTQTLDQLAALGPTIILANTYHLLCRPGPADLRAVGGLHAWMGWDRALLTDSGGFQIFSLPGARTMTEAGAEFRSYVDGRRLLLSPETSIDMQLAIGSDIMMVLDQCIDATSPRAEAVAAMALTHRWAARSLAARGAAPNGLFAIVQGACFPDLRRQSAEVLTSMPGFDGFAIGGLAVGEGRAQREDMTELAAALLPADRPRYLMGVGTPIDLLEGVRRGVDMFDCVLPTALAQQGVAFTSRGKVDLRRGVHRTARAPLDPACPCDACARYARSYLHHLVKCKEPLGWQLLAFHNLRFYLTLMRDVRAALAAGTFDALYAERREVLEAVDLDTPPGPAQAPKARGPRTLGAFALHEQPGGAFAIRHVASGEVMHPSVSPDEEASALYVHGAHALRTTPTELVVWDVGLGAGHNAMALVRWRAATPDAPPLVLHSFEHDLDALRLGLGNLRHLPHLRHEAPHRLITQGVCELPGLRWHLHVGDFGTHLPAAPAPALILYDPFSAKVDGAMWTLAAFSRLAQHLTAGGAGPTELLTYTASTAIRTSMLLAGFEVGAGPATGSKRETTFALHGGTPDQRAALRGDRPLLDHAWLARRARSTRPFADDVPVSDRAELEARLRARPQFDGATASVVP